MRTKQTKSDLLRFAKGETPKAKRVRIMLKLSEDMEAVVVKSEIIESQSEVDIISVVVKNREEDIFWNNFDFDDICEKVRKELTGQTSTEQIEQVKISAPCVADLHELWKI